MPSFQTSKSMSLKDLKILPLLSLYLESSLETKLHTICLPSRFALRKTLNCYQGLSALREVLGAPALRAGSSSFVNTLVGLKVAVKTTRIQANKATAARHRAALSTTHPASRGNTYRLL
jgi:hypothetical protein